MNIKQVKCIIDAILSREGWQLGNINIKCSLPLIVKIQNDNDTIVLNFEKSYPVAIIKKFVKLKLSVKGISLGKDGGTIFIKFFPDINFSYEDETNFGSVYSVDLESDIIAEYEDEERRKIARKCLQYANEWTTIVSTGNPEAQKSKTKFSRSALRKQCVKFVSENIKNDKEIQCGSVLLSFLFLYVVLPAVINWVVKKVLDKWFR